MRVLHVIDGIGVGGAELVLVQLVERLERLGVSNTILSLTPAGILRDRIVASGARLVEMDLAKGALPVLGLGGMMREMRAARPDVIQGWMYHGNFAATVLRDVSRTRAPMLWSMHNTLDPRPPFSRITRLAFRGCRMMSGRPGKIVYVAEAAARQHEAEGFRRDRTVIIPNGTDGERFKPSATERKKVRARLGLADDVVLLGCFARWAPMKGHSVLIEAFGRMRRQGAKVHLLLCGTLMERTNPEVLALIRGAGIEQDCSCLGERQDVDKLMTGLDGLVLASVHGEAFPMVLGEAMATGVTCVATDVGDSALLLGDTGFVVPPSDVEALTVALGKLVDEGREARIARGYAARRRVLEHYSIDRMAGAYLSLYQSACAGHGAG